MSFRVRVFIAFALAVLPPLGLLAWGIRREVDRRITAEYEQRAEAAGARLATEIEGTSAAVRGRLAALAGDLGSDNRIRLALLGEPAARRHLLDWGGEAGRLSGLALLELQDERGRILSSAHFRNEYGLERPTLPRFLSGARGPAMVRARTPDGSLVALAGVDSVRVGATTLVIAGGLPFDEAALVRVSADPQLSVRLALPGSSVAPTADHAIVRTVTLPFLDLVATPAGLDSARLLVVQSRSTIAGLRRSLDGWVALTIAGAASVALLLAAWLAGRVSRPLRDLTRRTEAIDLDRLEQSFASSRSDEIGTLTRVLGAMTERLRASAGRLREAERRLAMGDLARQVNHDIKNGLTPVRNVLRHLDDVAPSPAELARVYAERRGTLESSVAYLDTLARNYARLTPATTRERCDVNLVVEEVVRALAPGRVAATTAGDLRPVAADRIALRRILENLVGNAVDSLTDGDGAVSVTTAPARGEGGEAVVRITVEDQGRGMSREELDRAFDDFFTTKAGGTGLGLSIVRRLVLDLGGALRVDTKLGEGTKVTVDLPVCPEGSE